MSVLRRVVKTSVFRRVLRRVVRCTRWLVSGKRTLERT